MNALITLVAPGDGGEIPPYLAEREKEKQFFPTGDLYPFGEASGTPKYDCLRATG